jgi:hypothetical protein
VHGGELVGAARLVERDSVRGVELVTVVGEQRRPDVIERLPGSVARRGILGASGIPTRP